MKNKKVTLSEVKQRFREYNEQHNLHYGCKCSDDVPIISAVIQILENLGFHVITRKLAFMADWYRENNMPALAELVGYGYRVVLDVIDDIRRDCDSLADVVSLLDCKVELCKGVIDYYKNLGFMHFAELALVKFKVLSKLNSRANSCIERAAQEEK